MRRCWYYGQGATVVCGGKKTDEYRPYIYVVSDVKPRVPGAVGIECTGYKPYEFDGLRYKESSGTVWRVEFRTPRDVRVGREGLKVSQSYIPYALRVAGDLGISKQLLLNPIGSLPQYTIDAYERAKGLKILAFDVEEVGDRVYVGFSLDGRDVNFAKFRKGERVKPSDIPDADYLVGYNSWQYDWRFLPAPTPYAVVTPRGLMPHIDLFPAFKGGFGSSLGRTESALGLYDIARQLGVHKALNISDVDLYTIKSMRRKLRALSEREVKAYLWVDVAVTWHVANIAVRVMEVLGSLVGANAMVVAQVAERFSPAVLFEFLAHKRLMEVEGGVFVDRSREWNYEAGEKVFAAQPGLFHTVAEYDINAMYPTLIAIHGVDPTSARECPSGFPVSLRRAGEERVVRVCWGGGPVHEIVTGALLARRAVKKVSKSADQALKIVINAAYGTMAKGGTGIINEVASAYIAQISTAVHKGLREKYKPIYGDTDSLYVQLPSPEAADPLLEELNNYLRERWAGPYSEKFNLWLEFKLEGVYDVMWIPPKDDDYGDDEDDEGEATAKNYIKLKGDELVVKGNAVSPSRLPLHFRYGGFLNYARGLLTGKIAVSAVLDVVAKLPIEELFVEASRMYRNILFVRDRKTRRLKKPDGYNHYMGPFLAALVKDTPVFVAKYSFDGRAWDVETKPEIPSLDDFLDVLYLPVETEGPTKSYILYDAHEETAHLISYIADFDSDKIVVTRTQKRPVSEDVVRERAKAVILDHPLFAYFSQGRLL